MDADVIQFLKLLKDTTQFKIPIFQRKYSWEIEDCQKLWDDIMRVGEDDSISRHFIGSVVYMRSDNSVIQNTATLIDGQQRLTTVTLLIVSLIDALGESKLADDTEAKKLRNYYIVNPEEKGEKYYKLILTETDNKTLRFIVNQEELLDKKSIRISKNFEFFNQQIQEYDINSIWKGLQKICVVGIALVQNEDNPQLIFESINSTGRKLSQADLIRNFVLMGLSNDTQEYIYKNYWQPIENTFGNDKNSQFDEFMRHYLTIKLGIIPRKGDVYEVFKRYAIGHQNGEQQDIYNENLVKDIRKYAEYFFAIAFNQETDPDLKLAFMDLRDLGIVVVYPLLLELYREYQENGFSKPDFLSAVRLIESYVFRRAVCSIQTNSLNKTFATFMKSTTKYEKLVGLLPKIESVFYSLPLYRRFPRDEEFKEHFESRDLYHFQLRSYWLRRIENHNRKERVFIDEYSIEHIMPQSEILPKIWQEELGIDWKEIQQKYLHTLGNLTLTGYNSEMSNRSFQEKLTMRGGFKESPLRINKELKEFQRWNEENIEIRAKSLASYGVKVWKSLPEWLSGSEESIDEIESSVEYSVDDHPFLSNELPLLLFNEFKRTVFELAPKIIAIEFLKRYVAFKAETNFVDVIPRSNSLTLVLNMPFSKLNDPKGMCRDISEVGQWGNGEVEIQFSKLDQLPYITGLVRQSLELQLGENFLPDFFS